AVTFLINDGVYPSNTDRGYVLRFLTRRAIRNGKLLGYPNGFLTDLIPAVVRSLESGYPELQRNNTRIASAVRIEEQTFDRTLERGMAMLDGLIADAVGDCTALIGGEDAFTLHDTYGFPVELTREIAEERGVAVDTAAFERLMDEQRERARSDASAKRSVVTLAELPAVKSEFTGYEGLAGEGEIIAALKDGKPVPLLRRGEDGVLILDRSSFYAERGGQIGDRGVITSPAGEFDVQDTQYLGEAIAHHGVVRTGEMAVGERVRTTVHDWWRREIRRHHTSAHLLQRALKDELGDEVVQAGSWVGIDRMRFDFRWPGGALSPEQKRSITHRVNEMIRDDSHLVTRVLPPDQAKETGAIWMPGEKYGDFIRVVRAGPSIEFCGGTHSHTTGELGMFVILSEFSIGSGIRRIESCVSEAAEVFVARQSDLVASLSSTLATTPDELGDRIAKLQREVKDLQTSLGQLKARLAAADAQSYVEKAESSGDRRFVGAVIPEANAESVRHLSQAIRNRMPSGVIALAGIDNGSVSLFVSASEDLIKQGIHAGQLVKSAASLVGGKGGGQAAQAHGGGKNVLGADAAVRAIRDAVIRET
ncbi:MAG: alanine--tRNA ligase, partial [Candidatus Eremiobacteraeota bacterium]|nr:alanine--tRNA ligase [Candidatus Eremiobacteraeota bacterium]